MKILFTTDLHGDRVKYGMLVEESSRHKVDAVINGADMLPKNGTLFDQDEFITGYLARHLAFFERSGIHYLFCPGNDDLRIFDDLIEGVCKGSSYLHFIAQRKAEIGGYGFVGMNLVADYPFRLKDRCRRDTEDFEFPPQYGTGLLSTPSGWEELDDWPAYAGGLPTLAEELEALPEPSDYLKAVYVIHMPPAGLALDESYRYTESDTVQVGSRAVHDFIRKKQPSLTLHGHIHESPELSGRWWNKLGETLCIQPGQSTDRFTYVIVELDSMEAERFEV